MKYEKPELVAVADAACAIQGSKGGSSADSVIQGSPVHTSNAYEADE
jgi:hypothetical protein